MNKVLFVLNIVVLASTILDLRTNEADRLFSFGIVRILFTLAFLALSYFLAFIYMEEYAYPFFFNSENCFSLLLFVLAYRLYLITPSSKTLFIPLRLLFCGGVVVVIVVAGYVYFYPSSGAIVEGDLVFSHYGIIYTSALFLISTVLLFGWRLEAFWRSLDVGEKWRFKYLALGLLLICAILGWSTSYRLAFLRIPREHYLLLTIVLSVALLLMGFALARHRILNRKLFVSRKVVYATITPIVFSGFFIIVGGMSLFTRLFGWSVPFVLKWLIVIIGALGIAILALSGDIRRRVKYFISTNFYVNKYEYRDEWLAFSDLLQGKLTENGVVEAMYQILRDSMYTQKISIWLGDIRSGFQLIDANDERDGRCDEIIAGDDVIVSYLHNAPYLYIVNEDIDPVRQTLLAEKASFFQSSGIVLMVPLILGSHCVGFIGLGPEYTGGRYGHDDFDLLSALSSHAASALVAVQNAEELARARERSAYTNVSAFVLHDIKNAATMLDLVRTNAPEHINNPEFQSDMLETIDDALRRMGKVQSRLSGLKWDMAMAPEYKKVNIDELLGACMDKFTKKIRNIDIYKECPPGLSLRCDPNFICQIMENLIINARDACIDGTNIHIRVVVDSMVRIYIQDNGPGISADLLPEGLFEPFTTSKPNGSGIGLWQVRQLMECMGGEIQAKNTDAGGACFILRFPALSEIT